MDDILLVVDTLGFIGAAVLVATFWHLRKDDVIVKAFLLLKVVIGCVFLFVLLEDLARQGDVALMFLPSDMARRFAFRMPIAMCLWGIIAATHKLKRG